MASAEALLVWADTFIAAQMLPGYPTPERHRLGDVPVQIP